MSITAIPNSINAAASSVGSAVSASVSAMATATAANAGTVFLATPIGPFVPQVHTTPDSLVVQPQIPPLLFSAVGSLVDETA
ncbi:MAG TPA: hypothetical protein VGL50_02725 [Steroidobacteraceae bacterium]|jgi:hypothetical protein